MNKNIENILSNNKTICAEITEHWQNDSRLKQKEVEAIHDMLAAMGGEVVVDTENDDYPTVTYDGGNHAEYASTINGFFTKIRAIEVRGYKLFEVDMESEAHYESSRFNLCDVDSIFDYVADKFADYISENE